MNEMENYLEKFRDLSLEEKEFLIRYHFLSEGYVACERRERFCRKSLLYFVKRVNFTDKLGLRNIVVAQ